MLDAIQGSKESGVESGASDGSDSPIIISDSVSEKSVEATPGSTRDVTESNLLGKREDEEGEIYSDASTHTVVPDTFSDMDDNFDTALPTEFRKFEQATPVKEVVVEKEIDDGKSEKKLPTDKRKSEKKVPEFLKNDCIKSAEVSKPTAKSEILSPLINK